LPPTVTIQDPFETYIARALDACDDVLRPRAP
jgi:hypothetical protein